MAMTGQSAGVPMAVGYRCRQIRAAQDGRLRICVPQCQLHDAGDLRGTCGAGLTPQKMAKTVSSVVI